MRFRILSPMASSLSPGSHREPPVSLVSHSLPSPKSSDPIAPRPARIASHPSPICLISSLG